MFYTDLTQLLMHGYSNKQFDHYGYLKLFRKKNGGKKINKLLLKPGGTIKINRNREELSKLNQALIEKRPQDMVFQQENGPSYTQASSDYHLFSSMAWLAEKHFRSYEEVGRFEGSRIFRSRTSILARQMGKGCSFSWSKL